MVTTSSNDHGCDCFNGNLTTTCRQFNGRITSSTSIGELPIMYFAWWNEPKFHSDAVEILDRDFQIGGPGVLMLLRAASDFVWDLRNGILDRQNTLGAIASCLPRAAILVIQEAIVLHPMTFLGNPSRLTDGISAIWSELKESSESDADDAMRGRRFQ